MPYYDTLDKDLARAKVILRKGKPSPYEQANFTPEVVEALRQVGGGTIYGADVYAAYKLLESFVEFIEQTNLACACRLNPYAPEELAVECPAHAALRAEVEQLRQDAERERLARRAVDEALRQALARNEQLRRGWDDPIVPSDPDPES